MVYDSTLQGAVEQAKRDVEAVRSPILSIVGPSRVGKSTMINSLRGLAPSDERAAKVGATETTLEKQIFEHHGLLLLDVPGADGSKVGTSMGEDYIQQFALHESDAILFVYGGVFNKAMCECARILEEKHKKPVFFVRNKVECDCENEVEDGRFSTFQEAFDNLRSKTFDEFRHKGMDRFADDKYIFLVSAKYKEAVFDEPKADRPWQCDWQRLKGAIFEDIQDELKRDTLKAVLFREAQTLAKVKKAMCYRSRRRLMLVEAGVLTFSSVGEVLAGPYPCTMWQEFIKIFELQCKGKDDCLRTIKDRMTQVGMLKKFLKHTEKGFQEDLLDGDLHLNRSTVLSVFAAAATAANKVWADSAEMIEELATIAEKVYTVELGKELASDASLLDLTTLVDEVLAKFDASS